MAGVNETLQDSSVRHSVYLIRYGGSLAKRAVTLLDKADADLVNRIRARLEKIDQRGLDLGPATTNRLQRLLVEIRTLNQTLYAALYDVLKTDLTALAKAEVEMTAHRLTAAVGVDFGVNRPAPELLRAAVTSRPFQGRNLRDWAKTAGTDKVRRVSDAVRIGLVEGQTTDQIVGRIRGTRAFAYRDGILEISRRGAEMVARTAVNHVANRAQNMLYQANGDVIKSVRWVSTLDSRTSAICRSRDGEVYPLGAGPRPPAHPNCRSSVTPITKSWDELSENGSLSPGRGSTNMETIFRKQLRDRGFTAEQIEQTIMGARASMNGEVPGALNYSQWLKGQSAALQDDILGKAKGRLFRSGGLGVDKFVDRAGRELNLSQLRAKYPSAFDDAGLD